MLRHCVLITTLKYFKFGKKDDFGNASCLRVENFGVSCQLIIGLFVSFRKKSEGKIFN